MLLKNFTRAKSTVFCAAQASVSFSKSKLRTQTLTCSNPNNNKQHSLDDRVVRDQMYITWTIALTYFKSRFPFITVIIN